MSMTTGIEWPDQLPELAELEPHTLVFEDRRRKAVLHVHHDPQATNVLGVFAAAKALECLGVVTCAEPVFKPNLTAIKLQLKGDGTNGRLIDHELDRLVQRIGPKSVFVGVLVLKRVEKHRVNNLCYGQTIHLVADSDDAKDALRAIDDDEFIVAIAKLSGVAIGNDDNEAVEYDNTTIKVAVAAGLTRKRIEQLAAAIAGLLRCSIDYRATKYENDDFAADMHAKGLAEALRTLLNDPDAVYPLDDEETEGALTGPERVGV